MPSGKILDDEYVLNEVKASLGKELWSLIEKEDWTDIMVNPDGTVWIDGAGRQQIKCDIKESGLESAAMILASYSSTSFNASTSQSLVAVIPKMGIRCSFMGPPAVKHTSVSFRRPSKNLIKPEMLVESGTITQNQLDFLRTAISGYKNILISGGTGCHAKGTMIKMADGSDKAVEKIEEGEFVMGNDGKPRKVLRLHRGYAPMVSIEPIGGNRFVVNEEHILALVNKYDMKVTCLTVEAYRRRPESWQREQRLWYSSKDPNGPGHIRMVPFFTCGVGGGLYYGFETDGNHLYCLSDWMVVHNSGKTTIMNSLMTLIDPMDRLYVVQDTEELDFSQEDVFSVVTNNHFGYADAIAQALRHNPTRIIVGECRFPDQAAAMIEAWNTGHPGGIATIHADNARDVLKRLDDLQKRHSNSGVSDMDTIERTIDVALQMRRTLGAKRQLVELLDIKENKYIV